MRGGRWLNVAGIGLLALLAASSTGCKKKVAKADCARLADKGADLKLAEDPAWASMAPTRKAVYQAGVRATLEKTDSDFQQANRCDPDELSNDELQCGMKAKTFNEWGACIN